MLVIALSWVGVWASGSRTAFAAGVVILLSLVWSARSTPPQSSSVLAARLVLIGGRCRAPAEHRRIDPPAGDGSIGTAARFAAQPDHDLLSAFVKEMWNRNNYGAAATVMIQAASAGRRGRRWLLHPHSRLLERRRKPIPHSSGQRSKLVPSPDRRIRCAREHWMDSVDVVVRRVPAGQRTASPRTVVARSAERRTCRACAWFRWSGCRLRTPRSH